MIDHLPGEILDRECLMSVVQVLITEQLHRSVPLSDGRVQFCTDAAWTCA